MSPAEAKQPAHLSASDREPTHQVLLQRAAEIAARARLRAVETETNRSIPRQTIAELWDAELMRVAQPRRFGGLERSWAELFELSYTLAQGCGSTGWVFCVLAGHSRSIGEFPIEAQEEVWGKDSTALVSSAFAPTGQAKPVDGGFRISGRFPFSSGSDEAQWAIVGALAPTPQGIPAPLIFLVPRTELSVIDDWHTLGLVGTGSKSLVADDVFVPTHRVKPIPPFNGSVAPFSLQAVIVGAARGGLEAFIAETKARPGRMGLAPPAASDLYQLAVGQSWGEVNAAWELLLGAVRRTDSVTTYGQPIPEPLVADNRAANAVISQLSVSAIERVHRLSGGGGVYNTPVSRAYRDVVSGAQHMATNSNMAGREAGALLLAKR